MTALLPPSAPLVRANAPSARCAPPGQLSTLADAATPSRLNPTGGAPLRCTPLRADLDRTPSAPASSGASLAGLTAPTMRPGLGAMHYSSQACSHAMFSLSAPPVLLPLCRYPPVYPPDVERCTSPRFSCTLLSHGCRFASACLTPSPCTSADSALGECGALPFACPAVMFNNQG
jgi:hypothetical protein